MTHAHLLLLCVMCMLLHSAQAGYFHGTRLLSNTSANFRGGANQSKPKPKVAPLSVFQTLVAGGTARSLSQAVTYPMDALRTISQTRKGAKKLSELGAGVLISGCVQVRLDEGRVSLIAHTAQHYISLTTLPILASLMLCRPRCLHSLWARCSSLCSEM